MRGGSQPYWRLVSGTIISLIKGIKITGGHMTNVWRSRKPVGIASDEYFTQNEGLSTLQYPKEKYPLPDNGRNKLHNEIEDCIVCDKCAKVCPVDCIEIEAVRAVEDMGKTSDGTPKRIHAATFNIDMSKCCFCGLCTTVCPTECLTMTSEYDFSTFDLGEHNVPFGNMSEEEVDIKKLALERFNEEKKRNAPTKEVAQRPARVVVPVASKEQEPEKKGTAKKPVFKPKVKVKPVPKTGGESEGTPTKANRPRPVTSTPKEEKATPKRPVVRPVLTSKTPEEPKDDRAAGSKKPKPVLTSKAKARPKPVVQPGSQPEKKRPKPVVKPSSTKEGDGAKSEPSALAEKPIPKKVKPVMKPAKPASAEANEPKVAPIEKNIKKDQIKRPKPVIKAKPIVQPKPLDTTQQNPSTEENKEKKVGKRPRPIIKKKTD